jgi:ABC-type nitrate/sulfonate/bicarbonate transport system permease component
VTSMAMESLPKQRQSAWRSAAGCAAALLLRSGAVLLLLAAWELASLQAKSMFFPPPSTIVAHALSMWFSGPAGKLFLSSYVYHDVFPSIARLLAGWAAAVVAGIALGATIGRLRLVSNLLTPSIEFFRSLPGPALIPIFLILLGTEAKMRIVLIAFGSVWPILLNTIEGVRTVDSTQIAVARVFKLPLSARIMRLVIPAALPKVFAGMRIALAISVILMVVSELVASTDGIGHQISEAQTLFKLRDMWAGIILLAILGLSLNGLFSLLEKRVLHWHRGARQRNPKANKSET